MLAHGKSLVRRNDGEFEHDVQDSSLEEDELFALAELESGAKLGAGAEWRLKKWKGKLNGAGRKIGAGAFGVVYKSNLHCGRHQAVAVKVQSKTGTGWEKDIRSEVNAMQMFNSKRFVNIFDEGWGPTNKNKHSIMMQLANGGDLSKYTKSSRFGGTRASMVEVLRFTMEILEGLTLMHGNGVVHRDLKPDNVFVHCTAPQDNGHATSQECHAKVADLGLACRCRSGGANTVQVCSSHGGTPIYLAPEIAALFGGRSAQAYAQASSQKSMDLSNDIFAVGLMMYEMIFQQGIPVMNRQGDVNALYLSIAKIRPASEWLPSTFPSAVGWSTFTLLRETQQLLMAMVERDMTKRIKADQAFAIATRLHAQALVETGQPTMDVLDLEEDRLDACFHEEGQVSPGAMPAPSRKPTKPSREVDRAAARIRAEAAQARARAAAAKKERAAAQARARARVPGFNIRDVQAAAFAMNDLVRVKDPRSTYNGKIGRIVRHQSTDPTKWYVRGLSADGDVLEPVPPVTSEFVDVAIDMLVPAANLEALDAVVGGRDDADGSDDEEDGAAGEDYGEDDEDAGDASITGDEFVPVKCGFTDMVIKMVMKGVETQLSMASSGGDLNYLDESTGGAGGHKRKYGPQAFWKGKWAFIEIGGMPVEQAIADQKAIMEGFYGSKIVVRARCVSGPSDRYPHC